MTERPDNDYTDHDLLILLSERMRTLHDAVATLTIAFKSELSELRKEFRDDIGSLKERVTVIERKQDEASGFLSGAKWLWGILLALPAGAVAYIFGVSN